MRNRQAQMINIGYEGQFRGSLSLKARRSSLGAAQAPAIANDAGACAAPGIR